MNMIDDDSSSFRSFVFASTNCCTTVFVLGVPYSSVNIVAVAVSSIIVRVQKIKSESSLPCFCLGATYHTVLCSVNIVAVAVS